MLGVGLGASVDDSCDKSGDPCPQEFAPLVFWLLADIAWAVTDVALAPDVVATKPVVTALPRWLPSFELMSSGGALVVRGSL